MNELNEIRKIPEKKKMNPFNGPVSKGQWTSYKCWMSNANNNKIESSAKCFDLNAMATISNGIKLVFCSSQSSLPSNGCDNTGVDAVDEKFSDSCNGGRIGGIESWAATFDVDVD